jgi:hypothetical protein
VPIYHKGILGIPILIYHGNFGTDLSQGNFGNYITDLSQGNFGNSCTGSSAPKIPL